MLAKNENRNAVVAVVPWTSCRNLSMIMRDPIAPNIIPIMIAAFQILMKISYVIWLSNLEPNKKFYLNCFGLSAASCCTVRGLDPTHTETCIPGDYEISNNHCKTVCDWIASGRGLDCWLVGWWLYLWWLHSICRIFIRTKPICKVLNHSRNLPIKMNQATYRQILSNSIRRLVNIKQSLQPYRNNPVFRKILKGFNRQLRKSRRLLRQFHNQ